MFYELILMMSEFVLSMGPLLFPDAFSGTVYRSTTPYPRYRTIENMGFPAKIAFFFFPDAFLITTPEKQFKK